MSLCNPSQPLHSHSQDLANPRSLDTYLVDPHLVGIPRLRTLTARCLARGNLQVLRGQADGALDAEVLALGALNELGADLLEGLDVLGREGDAYLVDFLWLSRKSVRGLFVGAQ